MSIDKCARLRAGFIRGPPVGVRGASAFPVEIERSVIFLNNFLVFMGTLTDVRWTKGGQCFSGPTSQRSKTAEAQSLAGVELHITMFAISQGSGASRPRGRRLRLRYRPRLDPRSKQQGCTQPLWAQRPVSYARRHVCETKKRGEVG